MSDFEDLIRRTMRAHDDEAPTVDQFRQRDVLIAPHRSVRWLAVAAAAACVLAIVGALVAVNRGGSHHDVAAPSTPAATTPAGPSVVLTCPKTFGSTSHVLPYSVPQLAHGVDARSRLVPQELPGHVVVCSYPEESSNVLTQQRQLSGDLSIIPATFSWLPRSDAASSYCRFYLGPHIPGNYLFGISYPDGTIWISAPRQTCEGASNGQFTAADNLSTYAQDALSTGTWQLPGLKRLDGCPGPTARLGQESALVPADPVSVQVCERDESNPKASVLGSMITGAQLRSLVTALGALPTEPWGVRHCLEASPYVQYVATFYYALGPSIQVTVDPNCGTWVTNGSLQLASGEVSVLALIRDLLPH